VLETRMKARLGRIWIPGISQEPQRNRQGSRPRLLA
jgi:hypothetical protein